MCVSVCVCMCYLNVTTATSKETYSNITPNFVTLSCSCVGAMWPFLGAVCAHAAPHWQFLVFIGSCVCRCVCVFELQCCVPSPCGSQTAAWLEIALITVCEPSSQSIPPRRRMSADLNGTPDLYVTARCVYVCLYVFIRKHLHVCSFFYISASCGSSAETDWSHL